MHTILWRIADVVASYEKARGHRPTEIDLPMSDADDLADVSIHNDDREIDFLDESIVDDPDERQPTRGPDSLEGIQLFGAVVHIDPAARRITCR